MRTILFVITAVISLICTGYIFGVVATKTQCNADKAAIVVPDQSAEIAKYKAEIADLKVQIEAKEKAQQIETIKTKVIERVVQSPAQHCEVNEKNEVVVSPYRFDNFTVRMLNDARADYADTPTPGNNETDSAPSDVGIEELISNDLDVVGQYHDLSKRHVGLQNYLSEKQLEGYVFCKMPDKK